VARYLGPKAKLSRREGTDLFLKSARRAISDKASSNPSLASTAAPRARAPPTSVCNCARSRRSSACTACWSASSAATSPRPIAAGNTGANLLALLESRLDNVVYRMGFGSTRAEARQLVSHKALTVNGVVVNIASYQVKVGDVIAIREKAKKQLRVADALKLADSIGLPAWVQVDISKMEGVFKKVPDRDEFGAEINESLIVELYSR
jgi:small subunit ribosomal protein S4